MNLFITSGNLTRDPESKTMTNGKARCMFTVAANRPYKREDGGRDADFITCIAYDRTAEIAERYLEKGRFVQVTGHVRTGSYEKDGRRIYTTEFIADSLELGGGGKRQQESTTPPPDMPDPDDGEFKEVTDDELPF